MPTPDNPDEFFLLLALVVALFPLQWHLGRKLHKNSTAGTSFFIASSPSATLISIRSARMRRRSFERLSRRTSEHISG